VRDRDGVNGTRLMELMMPGVCIHTIPLATSTNLLRSSMEGEIIVDANVTCVVVPDAFGRIFNNLSESYLLPSGEISPQ
jgi:hypothetical protein